MRSLLSNKTFLILTLVPALVVGLSFNAALLEAQVQLSSWIPRDRHRSQRRRHCQRRSHGYQRGEWYLSYHRDHRGRRL